MIEQNTLIMLSNEEYSDYVVCGPYRVLKSFDIHAIAAHVKNAELFDKETTWKLKNGPDDVVAFLKSDGYIEEVACPRYHLGCYGRIEVTEES